MPFEIKIFEIELPVSKEKLEVRAVSSSELIHVYNFVPDFFDTGKSLTENAKQIGKKDNLEGIAKWACMGIHKHGTKKLVPTLECGEGEFSYFQLHEDDKGYLFQCVFHGKKPDQDDSETDKKKLPPKSD